MLQAIDSNAFERAYAEALQKPTMAPSIGAFLESKYGANSTRIEVIVVVDVAPDVFIPAWVKSLNMRDYLIVSTDKRHFSVLSSERFAQQLTCSPKGFGFYVSFKNDKTTVDEDAEFTALFSAVLDVITPHVEQLSTDRSDDTGYESPGAYWEGENARKTLVEARALFQAHRDTRRWRGMKEFFQRRPTATQWQSASI